MAAAGPRRPLRKGIAGEGVLRQLKLLREDEAQVMGSKPMPGGSEEISWAGSAGCSGAKSLATLPSLKTHYQIVASEI